MLDYPRFYPDQVVPSEKFGDRIKQIQQGEVEAKLNLLLDSMRKRRYHSLVFLLDESDGLKKHVVGLQILRNVWTSLCKRGYNLGFFFAGSENLVERLGRYSPLKRHCIPIELKRFTKEECLSVINKLEEGSKNKLDSFSKMRLANISGGYPHHIHVLGNYIVLAMKEGKKNSWQAAFKNYLFEINEYERVVTTANQISTAQKKILLGMNPFQVNTPKAIAKRSKVPQDTIPTQLNRLLRHNVVRRMGYGAYELVDRNLVEYLRITKSNIR